MNIPRSLLAALYSLLAVLTISVFGACSSNPPVVAGPGEADQILLDRGNAALKSIPVLMLVPRELSGEQMQELQDAVGVLTASPGGPTPRSIVR